MNQPHDPNRTVDLPVSEAADSLAAGLAAGFGQPLAPRSSLGDLRPVLLKEAEGESAHIVKPKSDAMPPREETGDRYRLDGEIARGGMGAVLRGRDVDLGRDLAVKVLLEKYAHSPEVARRFIEEAQIGGQLQHPGVVPVYDIGRFGERPFFTMKLVKGQTLAAILEERKGATAERPRLLGIALKVCETLGYAHARGVIHRDLKPANVMVGAFGEVQVMDWGLAKVLAEGGIADEERASRAEQQEDGTQIRTARSTGSAGSCGTATEAGSLLGTPAYMPPEQANGDIAHLDRRCDVFGLGAILCAILTGKPPYAGRSGAEVRRQAANGDLADATARLNACGADAELIALVMKCLSPEALDRPRDAQEVANGLSAYLNGVQERLQTAERERAVAVVREAEQRQKRKVQLALGAAVAALMLGGGAFAFWRAEQAQAGREREARNAEAVAALLGQAEEALKAGDARKAEVVLEAAKKRSAEGGADSEAARLKRLEADLALLRDLDAVDQFRWTVVESRFPDDAEVARRAQEALKRFGIDPESVAVDEAAQRAVASAVRERIESALDLLLLAPGSAGASALLARLDADEYRAAVRAAVRAGDADTIAQLATREAALEQEPGFAAFLGENGAIPVEQRRALLLRAVRRRPGNLGLLMALGNTYPMSREEGADERLRWFQAAIAAAPANAAAHNNLGVALVHKEDLAGAEAALREAIRLDARYAKAHTNLGVVLHQKQDLAGAEAAHRESIHLEPKLAEAHSNLGNVLHGKQELAGAEAAHREAIRLDPKYAKAHSNLGIVLADKQDPVGAEAAFREAIRLDPKLAEAHNNLGNVLADRQDLAGAEAAYREAIRLDAMDALGHYNLGILLHEKQDQAGAEAAHREAIRLEPNYASAHAELSKVLLVQGRFAEAKDAATRALALLPEKHPLAAVVSRQVQRCERMLKLDERLPLLLGGKETVATAQERLDVVTLCQRKRLYVAAARFAADALAADQKLGDDPRTGIRYNAACFAALAAAGKGEDAAKLDDAAKAKLRGQALDWLRAELKVWSKLLASGPPQAHPVIADTLSRWEKDAHLAGIRDQSPLGKLPTEEQKAFSQLWTDVAALLKQAAEKTK